MPRHARHKTSSAELARQIGYCVGTAWANRNPAAEPPDLVVARLFLEARSDGGIPGAPAAPRGALYRTYRGYFLMAVADRAIYTRLEQSWPAGPDGQKLGNEWANLAVGDVQCEWILLKAEGVGHTNCALRQGHAFGHRTCGNHPQAPQTLWRLPS